MNLNADFTDLWPWRRYLFDYQIIGLSQGFA
jgi:hypothetical protein